VKKSKLSKLIQKPLRFHHQDIHEEIEGLTELLLNINNRLVAIERKLESVSSPHRPATINPSQQ
jgi:predicted AAA+ superfamily ATPase